MSSEFPLAGDERHSDASFGGSDFEGFNEQSAVESAYRTTHRRQYRGFLDGLVRIAVYPKSFLVGAAVGGRYFYFVGVESACRD